MDVMPAPLLPLRTVVWGILVVAFDLNLGTFDVLVDPVGYAVVVLGVSRLVPLHRGFRWARLAALVGLAASALTLLMRRTEAVVTSTLGITSTTVGVAEPLVPALVEALAEAAFVVLVCTALMDLVRTGRVRRPARTLRWALPATTLAGPALALALRPLDGTDVEGDLAAAWLLFGLALVLTVLGLDLAVWFLVVLWRAAREPVTATGTAAAMIG